MLLKAIASWITSPVYRSTKTDWELTIKHVFFLDYGGDFKVCWITRIAVRNQELGVFQNGEKTPKMYQNVSIDVKMFMPHVPNKHTYRYCTELYLFCQFHEKLCWNFGISKSWACSVLYIQMIISRAFHDVTCPKSSANFRAFHPGVFQKNPARLFAMKNRSGWPGPWRFAFSRGAASMEISSGYGTMPYSKRAESGRTEIDLCQPWSTVTKRKRSRENSNHNMLGT